MTIGTIVFLVVLLAVAAGAAAAFGPELRTRLRRPPERAVPPTHRAGVNPRFRAATVRPRPRGRTAFTPRTTAPTAVMGGRMRGHVETRPDALCTVCARPQHECTGH